MRKYTVTGYATIVCSMSVEAETEEEAIDTANNTFWDARYGGGVLTAEGGRCAYPDGEPEFDEAIEVSDERRIK